MSSLRDNLSIKIVVPRACLGCHSFIGMQSSFPSFVSYFLQVSLFLLWGHQIYACMYLLSVIVLLQCTMTRICSYPFTFFMYVESIWVRMDCIFAFQRGPWRPQNSLFIESASCENQRIGLWRWCTGVWS